MYIPKIEGNTDEEKIQYLMKTHGISEHDAYVIIETVKENEWIGIKKCGATTKQ